MDSGKINFLMEWKDTYKHSVAMKVAINLQVL